MRIVLTRHNDGKVWHIAGRRSRPPFSCGAGPLLSRIGLICQNFTKYHNDARSLCARIKDKLAIEIDISEMTRNDNQVKFGEAEKSKWIYDNMNICSSCLINLRSEIKHPIGCVVTISEIMNEIKKDETDVQYSILSRHDYPRQVLVTPDAVKEN